MAQSGRSIDYFRRPADGEQPLVDGRRAGHDVARPEPGGGVARPVGDHPAGLPDRERPCGDVPGAERELEEAVEDALGRPAEIEARATDAAQILELLERGVERPQVAVEQVLA